MYGLKTKFGHYFDTVATQIPGDQPEIKAQIETARDELDKIPESTRILIKEIIVPGAQKIDEILVTLLETKVYYNSISQQ